MHNGRFPSHIITKPSGNASCTQCVKAAAWLLRSILIVYFTDDLKELLASQISSEPGHWAAKNEGESYLSIVGGENQGQVIKRADSGGKELLLVSQPDMGSLKHNNQCNKLQRCIRFFKTGVLNEILNNKFYLPIFSIPTFSQQISKPPRFFFMKSKENLAWKGLQLKSRETFSSRKI